MLIACHTDVEPQTFGLETAEKSLDSQDIQPTQFSLIRRLGSFVADGSDRPVSKPQKLSQTFHYFLRMLRWELPDID